MGISALEDTGAALQIQCYQCEEMSTNNCTTPDFIVNCTVNVQDMCQKEVLIQPDDPWVTPLLPLLDHRRSSPGNVHYHHTMDKLWTFFPQRGLHR
uniref:Uncharacterized protein n=1 Tax=Knipowitschia caucasica TaxID=637954 RepID=A0AAV2LES8_KNICA